MAKDRKWLSEAAKAANSKMPDNHVFFLIGTESNKPDATAFYVSNCSRECAIKTLKEVLFRWGEEEDWMKHIN